MTEGATRWVLGAEADGWCGVATPGGVVGLAFRDDALCRLWLPASDPRSVAAVVEAAVPGARQRALPPAFAPLEARLVAYFSGAPEDPGRWPLALDPGVSSPFALRVFGALREVARGETLSYGALAERAGAPRTAAARAVGQLMGRNRLPLVVPCHRVVPRRGGIGGFSAPRGAETKEALLRLEGAEGAAPLFEWRSRDGFS